MTGRYKTYPEYRDSGVAFLGDIPLGWKPMKIKHFGSLKGGAGFPHSEQGNKDQKYNFYKVNALGKAGSTGELLQSKDTISELTANNLGAYIFPPKTIVFAKVGAALLLGRIRSLSKPACIDNNMMGLVVEKDHCPDFVKYAMQLVKFDFLVNPGAVPSLNEFQMGNCYLAFAPYEEQQQIANFLDHETSKIDTLIEKQEKLIELLKEKRQAVISHAVTKGLNPDAPMKDSGVEWLGEVPEHWKACPLKTISKFRQGKLHEPYIHEDGKFICVNSRFVSTEGEKFKYCSKNLSPVENEDILMVMSDLPNGRALAKALFVQGDNNFALNQRVCAITATEIDARFLYYQLNRNEYFLSFDDGCNQTNLSNYVFKNFPALVPYKAEQCEIAEYLDRQTESFDRLVEIANRQIELMKERKTALISAAVTGKIDVRDWEGEA
ncbi:restriction endonuclease subunit S [Vibrio sp. 1636]|uniref:Type I restriction modification DNA specificity domain-containing protein n=1 Tax=Vibrio alginolyticus TaxID=663 RepID=A0A7Y0MSR4_VIBAL|nr:MULTISPECIES: restriction endonuclease subunit S [Vibrio]MDW2200686.1 restriction endonuclease subunit S [Vibrio sp. 1636]NMR72645.1 hypothetical protein [Vibrio alginolyticus]TOD48379.1 hypothetical protein CGJ64_08090 [Vibrio parahaemolyticus]WHR51497.1 restriction endonuclease subunit S [Vibrio furnissii]